MLTDSSPAEIVARLREVYRMCRTYRDEGSVVTRFETLAGNRERFRHRKPFATWFVRPDRFRFEYSDEALGPEDEWQRMVILQDRDRVRSSWTVDPGERSHPSLEHALGSAKGVSDSSSWTIPALLVPGLGDSLPRVELLRLVERRAVDGHECHGLAFSGRDGESGILWVGCRDHLLRRIEEDKVFDEAVLRKLHEQMREYAETLPPDERASWEAEHRDWNQQTFRTRRVTTYRPHANTDIEPEFFESLRSAVVMPRPAEPRFREPEASAPAAAEILDAVRQAYGRCATFRDSGAMTFVTPVEGVRKTTSRYDFSLAFQRPDRLRFENAFVDIGPEEDWSRFVQVWNGETLDGVDSRGKRIVPERESLLRLRHAFLPLGLLFPQGPDPLPAAASARLLGLADLRGQECFVVCGVREDGRELTLWISRTDTLVRRCAHVEVHDATSRAAAPARLEEPHSGAASDEDRRSLASSIDALSQPAKPCRNEVTVDLDPRPDAELDPRAFALD